MVFSTLVIKVVSKSSVWSMFFSFHFALVKTIGLPSSSVVEMMGSVLGVYIRREMNIPYSPRLANQAALRRQLFLSHSGAVSVGPKCVARVLNPANHNITNRNSLVKSPNSKCPNNGEFPDRTMMRAVLPFNRLCQPSARVPFLCLRILNANPGSHMRSNRPLRSAGIVAHHSG